MRMKPELNDWVCAAVTVRKPLLGNCVLRSANWLSDDPACSKSAQNMIDMTIRMKARISRCASTAVQRVIM